METRIKDLALSKDIINKVGPVLPKLTACSAALNSAIGGDRTWSLSPFEVDEAKARIRLRETIEILKGAIATFESAEALIDVYDESRKADYGKWLCRIVEQSKGSRYDLNGAKSLKACTEEQLNDIVLMSVFMAKYNPVLLEEVKEAGLGISTVGSLVVRCIKDNNKAVYEGDHKVHHLTLDDVVEIRKLQTLYSMIKNEVAMKKMDREREAEKAEKQAKKQKMNQ